MPTVKSSLTFSSPAFSKKYRANGDVSLVAFRLIKDCLVCRHSIHVGLDRVDSAVGSARRLVVGQGTRQGQAVRQGLSADAYRHKETMRPPTIPAHHHHTSSQKNPALTALAQSTTALRRHPFHPSSSIENLGPFEVPLIAVAHFIFRNDTSCAGAT